jgi:hypothetical protein
LVLSFELRADFWISGAEGRPCPQPFDIAQAMGGRANQYYPRQCEPAQ